MSFRLPNGGRIDRSRKLRFLFNGTRYEGHPGDTLASALVANGVSLVGRSLKYHRPRGLLSAGPQEPNALFHVGFGPRSTPSMKATEVELHDGLVAVPEAGWPSLDWDFGRVADVVSGLWAAGFPYKTFKGSPRLWERLYEPALRGAAGWGSVPDGPDGDRYDARWAHCDVLVVGGGPAGLAAALAASADGARVILADAQNEAGGHLLHHDRAIGGHEALHWVADTLAVLKERPEVTVLPRTTVTMLERDGSALAVERRTDHKGPQIGSFVPRQRLWRIRAGRVVLATGAYERPLVFPGNDRPGVMLADAVLAYVRRWAALPGRDAVVLTNNDGAYETAEALLDVGAGVVAVVDMRPDPPARLVERLAERGVEVLAGHAVVATRSGRRGITGATVRALSADGTEVHGPARRLSCGLLAVSGGWDPDTALLRQGGGTVRWDEVQACYCPSTMPDFIAVSGGCAGTFSLHGSLREGLSAGADDPPPVPSVREPAYGSVRAVWQVAGRQAAFVDLQNDATAADVALAVREGFDHPELLKRYAVIGLGTEQGRTAQVNALGILSDLTGRHMDDLAPTTARPPVVPVALGAIAGRAVGEFAAPRRLSPQHDWHAAAGAVFREEAGWQRPVAYPLPGETVAHAIERESLAVREKVGLHDAAPLGKIEVQGPDAGAFLDRVFTNGWSGLGVGRLRYGLMLTAEGSVLDDGIGGRLAPDRYRLLVGAPRSASVIAHFRACRAAWPELRVFVSDVTEHWATILLTGPRCRDVLGRLAPDLYLGARAFPFMTVQDAAVAGVPGRVARIGFTGELSFEILVPWSRGMAVWQAALEAGAAFGITPVGLGAMEVLRAEKGFILPVQDTDSDTTPHDLGYARLVDMGKGDFVGRAALERSTGKGRRELVGLLTEDPRVVLPEGAALTADRTAEPPVPVLGHVTSSCYSPTLGRSIALALLADGRARTGETVHAPLGPRTVTAVVAEPVFFDPEGRRRDG